MQHTPHGNDTNDIKKSTKEILKKEELIDPGNEHHHKQEDENDQVSNITKEEKTGKIKKEDFDTSGEDG